MKKFFISIMFCLSLILQTGLAVCGEELLISGEEEVLFQESFSETMDSGVSLEGEPLEKDGVDDSSEDVVQDYEGEDLITDEEPVEEGIPEIGADTDEEERTEGILEEETEVYEESLLEDPSGEELQVVTTTETVALGDPAVVSDTIPSPAFRLFRMAQYNGCFGNQLSGSALELYNARVNYYVSGRNSGSMILEYTSGDCPYTFEAEINYDDNGNPSINKETEAYQAFKQQVLFDLQSSLDAFIYDHPEIFWLRGGNCYYSIRAVGSAANGWVGYISKLTYVPTVAFAGADSLISSYDAAVTQVVSQIQAGADINGNGYIEQMELIMTAHDYLCERLYYDSDAYANYETTQDYRIFCSAGGFLDSAGAGVVCEGYAKSFKVICDRLEIPCVLIGGTVVQNGKNVGHMWNGVQVDGKWYLMDVTWDDSSTGYSYKYFMVGDITSRTSSGYFGGVSVGTAFVYPQLETESLIYCEGMRHANFTEKVVEPTCASRGYTEYTCTNCGFSYKDHYTDVNPENHSYRTVVTAPVCTAQGYTTYTCSRCGDSYKTEYKPALGHVYDNGVCTRCGIGDSIVNASVSSISSQAYGAKELTPAVTVKFGTNILKQGTDYTVTYRNNVKLGTAYAIVTGIGIYRGTVNRTFKIVKKSISAVTISSVKDRIYTGKAQKPGITMKNNGVKLVKNTDYTIRYSKNKSIGQAVITIKGKGNYTGTKKIYFKILPKAPTLSKVKSVAKGKLTAYWTRVSGVSGYQIQYSLKSSFSSVKSVTVSSGSVSKTISALKKGKVYYVRIRAYKKVDGKKYYSAWSKVKKVTVKKK